MLRVLLWSACLAVAASNDDFYGLSAKDIDGIDVDFSTFAGRAVLITNVASA